MRTLKEALAAWTTKAMGGSKSPSAEAEPPSIADSIGQVSISHQQPRSQDNLHSPGQPSTSAAAGPELGSLQGSSQRLVSPEYGYAALSGFRADSGRQGGLDFGTSLPRVHPSKRFMPGQRYSPQDLNPYSGASASTRRRGRAAEERFSAHDADTLTDFKNVAFLSNFLTPAGRLMPRKATRLPQRQHHRIAQAIKLARNMGLMAGETRLDKLAMARSRREEAFQVAMQTPEPVAAPRAAAAAAAPSGQPQQARA